MQFATYLILPGTLLVIIVTSVARVFDTRAAAQPELPPFPEVVAIMTRSRHDTREPRLHAVEHRKSSETKGRHIKHGAHW